MYICVYLFRHRTIWEHQLRIFESKDNWARCIVLPIIAILSYVIREIDLGTNTKKLLKSTIINVSISVRTFFLFDYPVFYSGGKVNKFLHSMMTLTVNVLLFRGFRLDHIRGCIRRSFFSSSLISLGFWDDSSVIIFSLDDVGVSERKIVIHSLTIKTRGRLRWSQSVDRLSIYHRFRFACFVSSSDFF